MINPFPPIKKGVLFYISAHNNNGMTLLYILLTVYILAVNFYAFQLLKSQRDEWTDLGEKAEKSDGKLILAAIIGGAPAILITMFCLRFRLSNLLFMIAMPVLSVLNLYCFFLGYRAVYLFL